MPIEHRIDHARRLVVATGRGVVTHGDIMGYQQGVWSRPDVAGYDELVDMTHVEDIALERVDRMREVADLSASMDAGASASKFAIVAPEELAFALGRMYAALRGMDKRSTKRVEVFRTMGEALAFLGVEGPL